jgi:hypothetical protein
MSWSSAEFHYWYVGQSPAKKRLAWDDLLPEQLKAYIEWLTFSSFADVARLGIDPRTIENQSPPKPDILCEMAGVSQYFELGEATDQELARQAGIAAKQGDDVFGGCCAPLEPLWRILDQKCKKKYEAAGEPVHLLLHYAVGHQVPATQLIRAEISRLRSSIIDKLRISPFRSVWLYDGCGKVVIDSVQI